jgi:proton glutamate symport protein
MSEKTQTVSGLSWDLLKNPWIIIISMLAGIALGVFNKTLAFKLAPFGDAFLAFLSMCVIPIMASAIITSIGRLFSSREAGAHLKRILVVFLLGLIITGVISLGVALTGNPGQGLDQKTLDTLGKVLNELEKDVHAQSENIQPITSFSQFINAIIPYNIFTALYEGKNLQILFFSIVFGLTIGILPSHNKQLFLDITEVVFKAFEKAISLAMYFLPCGLLCMLAGQVARAGVDILLAMVKFIILVHISGIIMIILGSLAIQLVTKKSLFVIFKELREPLILAFGTRNSYATMPSVFDALRDNFHLPQSLINLVVPLSIVICRYSMVVNFAIVTVFMAQLYSIPLGVNQVLLIFGGSIIAAVAGAGAPGVAALSMVGIILAPMGLPTGVAIV